MKKILTVVILSAGMGACMVPAQADAHEGFYHRGGCCYRGGYGLGWVAPAVVGGVIGYELSRPPVYVEPVPSVVYVQPQPTVQAPPPGYHWQDMVDPQTGVHKIVAVPN